MRCLLDERDGIVLVAPAEVALAVPVSTVTLAVPGTDADRLEQLRESLMLGPQIAKRARALLGDAFTDGITLIAEERRRQVEREMWSPAHDASHERGVLAKAAACYAVHDTGAAVIDLENGCDAWPWSEEWDKRAKHDELRRLVIAGALIAAEIDRMNGKGVPRNDEEASNGNPHDAETAKPKRTLADVVSDPPGDWRVTMVDSYETRLSHPTHAEVLLYGLTSRAPWVSAIRTYIPENYRLELRAAAHRAVAELLAAFNAVSGGVG